MYPNQTYPQKGIFCHEQVKALKKHGLDVDVVVPMTIYDKEFTTKVWDYEGVKIYYIRFFKIPGVCGFEYTGKSLYYSLERSKIDIKKYNILHADAPLPAGDAIRRISRKYGIPFVVHGHGLDVFLEGSYKNAQNCSKIVETCKCVYSEADAVVGVSHKVLEQIQKKVDIAEKAYVVYNGVDTERFYPIKKEKSEQLTITSIGNLIPLKGHDYTLRAIKQLIDCGHTNIRFKLAGRGYLEDDLKKLASELGISGYVEFIGYIPYDDIVKLLQSSDIFVLPSWYEALGCVYLEAMACGVPAVGCWGNGIDEIITDGIDGYIIEGKSSEQIADRLRQFIENNSSAAIGKRARLTVENKFKWEDSANKLIEVYGELI